MSLPSQSTRTSRSAGVAYRQSRPRPIRRFATPIVIVGALAIVAWFVFRSPSSTLDTDQPTDRPTNQNAQAASTAPSTPTGTASITAKGIDQLS